MPSPSSAGDSTQLGALAVPFTCSDATRPVLRTCDVELVLIKPTVPLMPPLSGFESMPAELLLKLTRYLPLQSLRNLRVTSRYLNDVISSNEWTVYRNAALYHAYASSESVSLADAKVSNKRYPIQDDACDEWKEYCRRCFVLDKNWMGVTRVEPDTRAYCESSRDVHRFKIDEELGLLFTSNRTDAKAAISVTDLRTGWLLWRTPSHYARRYTHVEYGHGYLVFDRAAGQKEVWRLADHVDDSVCVSAPDASQINASRIAERAYGRSGRGCLRPWTVLTTPDVTRFYRVVYPTLLAASQNTAYLWDLPSATLVQTIHGLQASHAGMEPLGEICYVDVNTRHVVLCGENGVRVVGREDNTVVLHLSGQRGFARTVLKPEPTLGSDRIPLTMSLRLSNAHLSGSGRDLACMLADGRLVLIRDFESIADGNLSVPEAVLEVDLTHVNSADSDEANLRNRSRAGYYLAFEQGRVAVATSHGLYVLTLDARERGLAESLRPATSDSKNISDNLAALSLQHVENGVPSTSGPPLLNAADIAVSWLPRLSDPTVLRELGCVQLSSTCLYVTGGPTGKSSVSANVYRDDPDYYEPDVKNYWTGGPMFPPRSPPRDIGFVVCCVDFSAPESPENSS
ncbi:uncharacterized protein B0H18DRAFT_1026275 [Fomitopsis serialis]|uniref:uncharacterized protein n=1 Tax=Fomitopsis serialis TaxID=139415 RepID=UPI00200768B8|nr:uncharacterized protein B0H18DRAFT_1026275 [Neoantrodia serialis]KAH9919936.1 hypothetical protein B0H18DRAFT_1026275 [Neoantrodia serialis]